MNRLLFIRYKKSNHIFEGGEQCSQKNFNVLSQILGSECLTTYYIHDESHKHSIRDYLKGIWFFFGNYFFGLTPKRVKEITCMAANYKYVFVDRSIFGIIAKKLSESHYQGQIICFFHNVERLYFETKVSKWTPWGQLIIHCADVNDRYCCRYSDKIIALNTRDSKEIEQRYNRIPDVLVPIALNDKYKLIKYPQRQTSNKPRCLFLGAYFPPNNEGIEWFFKEVYPHVTIDVLIVGKEMNKLRTNYAIPKEIKIVSDAPDLRPYFEEADIMVLPIFRGSGMKVKTCESLMYGKNIIGTTEAFEGYEVDYEKAGAKCDTAKEFIAAIQSFIAHPRPIFNLYSRQIFLEKYSENAVINKFEQVITKE